MSFDPLTNEVDLSGMDELPCVCEAPTLATLLEALQKRPRNEMQANSGPLDKSSANESGNPPSSEVMPAKTICASYPNAAQCGSVGEAIARCDRLACRAW